MKCSVKDSPKCICFQSIIIYICIFYSLSFLHTLTHTYTHTFSKCFKWSESMINSLHLEILNLKTLKSYFCESCLKYKTSGWISPYLSSMLSLHLGDKNTKISSIWGYTKFPSHTVEQAPHPCCWKQTSTERKRRLRAGATTHPQRAKQTAWDSHMAKLALLWICYFQKHDQQQHCIDLKED